MRRKASRQSASAAIPVPPLRVGVPESARLLGISRSLLYLRIARGHISVVKDGQRTLIGMDELRRYSTTNLG